MEKKESENTMNYEMELEKMQQTISQLQNYVQQLEMTIRILSSLMNR